MLAIGAIGAGVVIVAIAAAMVIVVALVAASIRGHRKARSKAEKRACQPVNVVDPNQQVDKYNAI